MDGLTPTQKMPADYYSREAARLRRLAGEATTPAVKQHLSKQAAEFDRLAGRLENVREAIGGDRLAQHLGEDRPVGLG